MRYLPFFLFALLVGAYALADGYSSYKDAPPGGALSSDPAPSLAGDLNLDGYDVYGKAVKTTDAAPDASSLSCGQSAYWAAAAGANSTGGACYLSGGVGARKVAVVAAAIENDTLTIAGIKGGVATSATWTYNVAGIGTCAALTNSQCAVLLKNYCNTNGPALGIASCECADATCTVATVGFIPSTDTTRLTLTASDGSQTVTAGNNGSIFIGAQSGGAVEISGWNPAAGMMGVALLSGAGVVRGGVVTDGAGRIGLSSRDGSGLAYISSLNYNISVSEGDAKITLASPTTQVSSSAALRWGTDRGTLSSPAAGILLASGTSTTTPAIAYSYPKTITTADSGADANPAATTINPADANTILLACNDDDGCTGTITETSAALGMRVDLIASTYTTTIADSAGVVELAGGASWVGVPNDTLSLQYTGSAWVEMSRADNTP